MVRCMDTFKEQICEFQAIPGREKERAIHITSYQRASNVKSKNVSSLLDQDE